MKRFNWKAAMAVLALVGAMTALAGGLIWVWANLDLITARIITGALVAVYAASAIGFSRPDFEGDS